MESKSFWRVTRHLLTCKISSNAFCLDSNGGFLGTSKPDFETRVSIIKNKLYRWCWNARRHCRICVKNIKQMAELEGAIISLIAQSSLIRRKLHFRWLKKSREIGKKHQTRSFNDYIQKVVSDYFKWMWHPSVQNKKRHIVQARRQACSWWRITKASLASIGSQIGRWSCNRSSARNQTTFSTDKQFRKYVEDLTKNS